MASVGGAFYLSDYAFNGAAPNCSGSLMRVIIPEWCLKLKII